ncbi:hypothetical protein V8Z80_15300 [Orrella sp. JC864]|uniref:hypothetical protein n=1 Tax=Orrella sp. JC864 TaxID=3120298 RepID=UPI0030090754
MQAGGVVLALPRGSFSEAPMVLQWQGQPLRLRHFHAPVPVDVLLQALAPALPEGADLLIEPGQAQLSWFEAPTHWLMRLTGVQGRTAGWLSGWDVGAATAGAAVTAVAGTAASAAAGGAREPGMPAQAALLHEAHWPGEAGMAARRVQLYAGPALERGRILAGLRRAGWEECAAASAGCRNGHGLHLHCVEAAQDGACVLLREGLPR